MLTQGYQIDNQGSKALKTATLCFALALLTMATTSWFVVEGIQSTEPASSARWAKVAAGVLLLVLELAAFGVAGQWPEHKKVLRGLGWFLLTLEITLMSVSQISIGMTAAKAAAHSKENSSESREQAKEDREKSKEGRAAAAALRAEAKVLRKSKDPADKEKAAQKEAEAAEFSKSSISAPAAAASAAVPAEAVALSTPLVEIVGQGGLIALSVAISVALSLSGIVLMHVAGSLRRRAGGDLTVAEEILQTLREMRGTAPAPAPAVTSFKTGTVAPAPMSYTSKTIMAGAGALAAMAAPMAQAAPATVPTSGQAGQAGVPTSGQAGVPVSVQPRVQKAGAVRDTGTSGKSAGRYALVRAGVIAGTVKPSVRGIQAAEGGSKDVVGRYIKQLAAEGVIVPHGRGYALKGGARMTAHTLPMFYGIVLAVGLLASGTWLASRGRTVGYFFVFVVVGVVGIARACGLL